MKTFIWIVFGIYVIFANMVFKRVRAEQIYYPGRGEKILQALIVTAFYSLFVGLPGYLLHLFLD